MSHELEIIDGEAQMVFTGEREAIWHRLGKQIAPDCTPQEVMEAAGLNWSVTKVPLSGTYSDPVFGDEVIDTRHSALVRSSDRKILDVVPSSWNPVQNAEAFDFFNEFVEAGDMTMDTAGSLMEGKKVWALAKVASGFSLFGGDEVESYMLFSNPHQFGRSVNIMFTPVRVVCQNTLSMALSDVREDQVRHSHRTVFNAERAKTILGIANRKLETYKDQAEVLGAKRYTEQSMQEYFASIFPVLTTKRESRKLLSKQAERAVELVETQPGAEFRPGSLWNLFNAVTYITSNEYGRSDESRLNSVWYGANQQRNMKAMKLALELADAA